ncbi:MAG TPA: exodeoxyribonuclease V subunit alpha [Rubricoccaceae bacterium]|jgi:exodeoxyribonuclease V alpha subunit
MADAADALLFDALDESDDTTPLDVSLARAAAAADPERGRPLALAVALVSVLRRRGHSALGLAEWGGRTFPGTPVTLPDAGPWAEALRASPAVATADHQTVRPLTIDAADRVQLFRDWTAEARVAGTLARLVSGRAPLAEPAELAGAFAALFPGADADDRQAVAAAGAARHRLAVVAGGPGTGKTTTTVRLLALLLTARPALRIVLAAPTGKAAHRLGASVADGAARLPDAFAEVRARLPTTATTLHRLLDFSPSRRSFGRNATRPIPADVVVVDEASMVDLGLFAALVAAVRPGARLVLLGDRDQLPSVEAGAVFGDVCAVAEENGQDGAGGFAAFCDALGLPGVPEPTSALGAAVVRLERTYRYAGDSGLGALARALRDGDAPGVDAGLALATDVHVEAEVARSGPAAVDAAVWAHVRPHAVALCEAGDPAAALRAASAFRLLAPTRGGRRGVGALNRLVERRIVSEGLAPPGPWTHGRPVLVTANDHDRALYNGDVGVVWARRDGPPVVVFESADGAGGPLREVPVGLLPEHETAWATTVHKSQGSEFGRVVVVLPEAGSRQAERLTRELVYTAVTRAKGATADVPVPLVVVGTPDQLAEAAGRREARTTAFPDALRSALAG